jgi:hypothetical protein
MKKRYVYSLLFGIPGFFVAAIISLVVFGIGAGILWLYIFGDNPWPSSTEKVFSSLFILIFLVVWITSIIVGFMTGKKLEKDPRLNKSHILISGGLTLLFIILIVFQQLSVGNLGPKSADTICSDFCSKNGYSGSGMPPQNSGDTTCSCYDHSGQEVLKVPLEGITPDGSK